MNTHTNCRTYSEHTYTTGHIWTHTNHRTYSEHIHYRTYSGYTGHILDTHNPQDIFRTYTLQDTFWIYRTHSGHTYTTGHILDIQDTLWTQTNHRTYSGYTGHIMDTHKPQDIFWAYIYTTENILDIQVLQP
jgi:ribosomal protein L21E